MDAQFKSTYQFKRRDGGYQIALNNKTIDNEEIYILALCKLSRVLPNCMRICSLSVLGEPIYKTGLT